MPVSSSIAAAAHIFNQNAKFLNKITGDLSDEEWLKRPNDTSNHLLWVVAHMTWSRSALLASLGSPWTNEWLPQYGRGAKREESGNCPSVSEVRQAWEESVRRVNEALESASEETLAEASPKGVPSADGRMSGLVNFLAWHETYHLGQTASLRSFLGHPGAMG